MLVRIRYSHAFRFVPAGELVKRRVRLGVGFLHDVFSIGGIAGHPQSASVELIKILQGILFEAHMLLFGRLDVASVAARGLCLGTRGAVGHAHHVRVAVRCAASTDCPSCPPEGACQVQRGHEVVIPTVLAMNRLTSVTRVAWRVAGSTAEDFAIR